MLKLIVDEITKRPIVINTDHIVSIKLVDNKQDEQISIITGSSKFKESYFLKYELSNRTSVVIRLCDGDSEESEILSSITKVVNNLNSSDLN